MIHDPEMEVFKCNDEIITYGKIVDTLRECKAIYFLFIQIFRSVCLLQA